MKKHKKPPIRTRDTLVPVKISDFQKAAEEAVNRAIWLMETALREEFGFGEARLKRLREKVDELARHKTFDDWVDHTIKQKMHG